MNLNDYCIVIGFSNWFIRNVDVDMNYNFLVLVLYYVRVSEIF